MTRDERGTPVHESERARVLSQTLGEMWRLAAETERLETRESVEMRNAEDLRDEERGIAFNEASRKVRLDEEALRFPAGLGYEAKERLIRATIPEIDRRLRHTAGTRLADSGADAFTIKEILGHGSIQTSARSVHATDEGKRRAVEALASYSSQKVCHKIVTNEERSRSYRGRHPETTKG